MFKISLFILILICTFPLSAQNYIFKIANDKKIEFEQMYSKSSLPQAKQIKSIFNKSSKDTKIQNSESRRLINELSLFYTYSSENPDLLIQLQKAGIIENYENNYKYKIEQIESKIADKLYPEQWALKEIKAEKAWQKATGNGVVVAVCDTGIDFWHKDLKDNLWINSKEDLNKNGKFEPWLHTESINGIIGDFNGIDDDGNGYEDDVIGYDFVDFEYKSINDCFSPDAIPEDENEHGTLVSGIIAATANEIGIRGLAYNSKIMTVRVMDAAGEGEADDIARGIVYAAENGAKVLNFSFGENWKSNILQTAIKYAASRGCLMLSSSGNSNSFLPHFPSDYDEVMSIGAFNKNNNKSGISNYGSMLDMLAPGESIITTALNDTYKISSGTSLAAPYIAASAALIFELNPNLDIETLKYLLLNSATDINDKGWDVLSGTGILNVYDALEEVGSSQISFNNIQNYQIINTEQMQLKLNITAFTPLFESWSLHIGKSILPNQWNEIVSSNSNQVFNDSTYSLDLNDLQSGYYTLRLIVKLKNNSTLESRKYIQIVKNNISPLQILQLNATNVYNNDRREILITATTNYSSNFYIEIPEYNMRFDEYSLKENTHQIRINEPILKGKSFTVNAYSYYGADTAKSSINVSYQNDDMVPSGANAKAYSLPPAYLMNNVIKTENKAQIFYSRLVGLDIEKSFFAEFDDNKFSLIDSSSQWLPFATGDVNKDGKADLLTINTGKANIFTVDKKNTFKSSIYQSSPMDYVWIKTLYDIDKDGAEDLLIYDDSSRIFVKSYLNNKLTQIASTTLPFEFEKKGVSSLSAGNFNASPNSEIVAVDERGRIYVYKYENKALHLIFTDTTKAASTNTYITKCDIEADGISEFAVLSHSSEVLFNESDEYYQVWYLRVYKSFNNSFEIIAQEHIFGVRAGQIKPLAPFYRNGISAGNINNINGDEIIISAYPNLYAFTWKNSKFTPIWYYPNVFSNTALIYDFDNNGINEIGISDYFSTRFFELSENSLTIHPPTGFTGEAINETTAKLTWNKVENADFYTIYQIIGSNQAIRTHLVNQNELIIDTLKSNTLYSYLITASHIDLQKGEIESAFSYPIIAEVYPHKPITATNAKFLDKQRIEVEFDGKIPFVRIENSEFRLIAQNNEEFIPNSAITLNGNKVLLSFDNEIKNGNYKLYVSSFRDYYGTMSFASNLDLQQNIDNSAEKLYLLSANLLANSRLINLQFSEKVTISAEDISNYSIKPFGSVISSKISPIDSTIVQVMLSNDIFQNSRGYDFTLTVTKIESQNQKHLSEKGNSIGFVFSANDLAQPYVYPSPVKLSQLDQIVFANLTNFAIIKIMTLDGKLIQELNENDGNGGVTWDGKDLNGTLIEPGVYYYRVEGRAANGTEYSSELQKFMVIR